MSIAKSLQKNPIEKSRSGFTTRLFIGCKATSELQMHLRSSVRWKQQSIDPPTCLAPFSIAAIPSITRLEKIYHQGSEYLGTFIDAKAAPLQTVKTVSEQVTRLLTLYFPKYESSKAELVIFPQLFIF